MGVSDIRVQTHANNILKSYLQNGHIPDEFIVERALQTDLANFFDPVTGTFVVEQPLWEPTRIKYRQVSDFTQWNYTQTISAEDMQILYQDFTDQIQILTNKLYSYVTEAVRIRTKLQKLMARIQNLLLVSTETDGYTFSFFDTFVDASKTSYIAPFATTAIVNPETQSVQISNAIAADLDGNLETTTKTLNLLFLQDTDVSFIVLNPLPSNGITSLSSTSLTELFNNQATAWQKEITITGAGPLVAQLTVRVSPLDPVSINRIAIQTKMTDAAGQVIIQCQYSPDGISYFEIPTVNSSQVVSGAAEFNFPPVNASYFRFLITKNQSDSGLTYNLGFQYISFQQVTYKDGSDFYSIPISFPNNKPISKCSLGVCSVLPTGTNITYGIIRAQGAGSIEIPISSIEDDEPQFAQVLDISSYTQINTDANTMGSGLVWTPDASGLLHINVSGVTPSGKVIDPSDPTIPVTLKIFRNLGPNIDATIQPYDSTGFQVSPSGLTGFFQTIGEINNSQGININIGNAEVILDNQLVTGTMSLTEGLHKIATESFDDLQSVISINTDKYFAWNMKYVSLFDFANNVSSNDQGFFTYDSISGDIIINPIRQTSQYPAVDNEASFLGAANNDGTFMSSSVALTIPGANIVAPLLLNAGEAITITVDSTNINPKPKWVNEIDITNLISYIDSLVSVQSSMDGATWSDIIVNAPGPITNVLSIGAFKFPTPVYARYFRVIWVEGSQINTSTTQVLVYPPVFRKPHAIQSVTIYQPTGTVWNQAYDTQQFATNQTLTVTNAFNSLELGTFVESGSYITNISSIHVPKIILVADSNSSTIDPFITQLQVIANPIVNERSVIAFSFLDPNASQSVTEVRLHAVLSSNFEGITPELKNYRLKLL